MSDVLIGGGEMGALIRAAHWEKTPLGSPANWPQSLKTVVRILTNSRYQMWMAWGDDLTVFYNDAYRATLGVKHPWALGAPAREVWKEIWPDIGPRIEHVLRTGDATWDEALLLLLERSGYPEETYHTFSYSPLSDETGAVVGMLCVVMEETDRVIGERRLLTLRELASEIAAQNTRAEVVTATQRQLNAHSKDLPFTLIYLFGDAGEAILAGMTGIGEHDFIAPAIIASGDTKAIWPIDEIRREGKTITMPVTRDIAEDLPRGVWDKPPHHLVIAPIARQGQNTPAGFLVVGANPYRELDESYLGFITLLSGQVASGLANAQAYEDERRRAEALAEINHAKTTFFSNVSHEFRTPLTLMLGPLEQVLAKPQSTPLAEHRAELEIAHRNGVRLLKLVNTLLDFSRIEAGRMQSVFEPVDLAVLTAELASTFRSATEIAGLRLNVDCPPLPQPVYVDRDMWEKIILNLLSNAFKFTLAGEIGVAMRVTDDGGGVEVTIRDTGTGIPEAELPHLFERFRRVAGARGRSIEGSGIGLALVQELVRLNGGAIRVVSQVGAGSAFTITMPFGAMHLPMDAVRQGRSGTQAHFRAQAYVDEALGWLSSSRAATEDLAPRSVSEEFGDLGAIAGNAGSLILVADDNADMRQYLEKILRSAGFQIEGAVNGQDALMRAHRLKPDLILSDVMMPELDGFGLVSELRRDTALRDTPVLLLSARAGEEAKIEGLSAGADDYLTKPFSARELLARIRANLDMAALRRNALRVQSELRHQAELAQERAESVLASITDGFLTLDEHWRYTSINAAAERFLGYSSGELIGRVLWEVFPDLRNTPVETHLHHAMTARVSTEFQYRYEPFGKWLDLRAYPSRAGGLALYFQDTTARKNAEDALRTLNESLEDLVSARTFELRSKEARLRTIFETSFSYQGLLAIDGTLLEANATLLEGIGAKREDIVGKPIWDTPWLSLSPELAAKIRETIPKVAAGEVFREEIQPIMPDTGQRSFDLQMRPIRDEGDAVVGLVCEAVDVTAQRRTEQALRQAQKMEGIGQLTGGVAHDFNNLLTIIIGNLETVQRQMKSRSPDIASLDRGVEHAIRATQRAIALTQQLLAFARQQPLDPKPVDISRLVSGMSDLLRRTLGEQIAVETILAGDLWRANIDANQLEITILNLAINARDAMPEGGRLTIETSNALIDHTYAALQNEVLPGQYVMLAVTDNGVGMSPEVLAKAFDPFFTTKDIGHGTGLGLSQVYGFVKQSGGHVKIYSELGDGTTVKLYLPRFESDQMPLAEQPGLTVARARPGQTILVVEDDDGVRAHTAGILREMGYDVVEAENGNTALAKLEEKPEIRLLFTDIGLPGGMNGRQLADIARERWRNLKVLFTTGYARNAIVHDGRLDPGVQLITKPFTFVGLATKMSDILNEDAPQGRILLVEDEVLIQLLMAAYLEELGLSTVIAGSATDAKSKLFTLEGGVDAAIVDLGLPDAKGDGLAIELRNEYPDLPIIIASGHDQVEIRRRFSGQTAMGFLGKPYTLDQLRTALQEVGVLK